MKQVSALTVLVLIYSLSVFCQQHTEVYLAELNVLNNSLNIGATINISGNEGYDNQPSFYENDKVLFAKTRNGQTDIALYNIKDGTTTWLSNTPNGSEYSPLRIPGKNAVSAIRLDEDGLQRLYEYDLKTLTTELILSDLKVGYHVWYSTNIMVSTVLIENRMDLVVSNLNDGTNYTLHKNVGRSLHRIPNTDLVSFTSKEGGTVMVKSINPISGETKDLISLLDASEDVCWTSDGNLVTANDKTLLTYNLNNQKKWQPAFNFKEKEIYGISRMAISANGKYIALVSKEAADQQ